MVVIAIDTSQRLGGVALARHGVVLGGERFGAESSHLVEIGRTLDSLLSRHGLGVGDVDRIAVVSGPGSFTGLRIGLSFVKGLHAGLGADVVTIGTLALLALPHLDRYETVCTMVDAHRHEVYAAVFTRTPAAAPRSEARVVAAPCAMDPRVFLEGLPGAPAFFVGSGVLRYLDVVRPFAAASVLADPLDQGPSTEHLARIAHRLAPLSHDAVRSLEPDYIRSSAAELKRLKPINRK